MGRWTRVVAMVALVAAGAYALPDDETHLSLVPWKVLEPGDEVDSALVLFWIPSSTEELRRSALLTSDDLTLYASRCVAMRVVRFDDSARLSKLHVDAELPMAILADADGHVLGRVESVNGALSVAAIEELVRDQLDARMAAADAQLDDARRHLENDEVHEAETLYRGVWEERCVCPRQGRVAQRALRKLAKK